MPEDKNRIAIARGFNITSDVGKYLGVPIIHGRVRGSSFHSIVNKVKMRLSNWATNSLSFAGRATLVQSVLQTIPTYSMQVFRFPVAVCKELDQLCRNFLWGHSNQQRKIHLVNWEMVTRPKSKGGLDLHRFQEFNTALLGKIAWGLLIRPNELWAQFLINKYRGRWGDGWKLTTKQGDSWLWNAIVGAWNEINRWVGWSLNDGCRIKFWTDRWIYGKNLTEDIGVIDIPASDISRPVRDYIDGNDNWNWISFVARIDQ